eukprot:CAMPEP_0169109240 /NCGR_PEP_ID=MMETSP1015-20121227/25860_1 /TAXON_ID=342587 /ORGANISM="Karlodinium micrum, Strain CCMP2283" /LENGTH=140 /DNA_ID=CAMNT_0009170925 /DNA_START=31 /DNA_END=453 /DNA_ORIENTATION=+
MASPFLIQHVAGSLRSKDARISRQGSQHFSCEGAFSGLCISTPSRKLKMQLQKKALCCTFRKCCGCVKFVANPERPDLCDACGHSIHYHNNSIAVDRSSLASTDLQTYVDMPAPPPSAKDTLKQLAADDDRESDNCIVAV